MNSLQCNVNSLQPLSVKKNINKRLRNLSNETERKLEKEWAPFYLNKGGLLRIFVLKHRRTLFPYVVSFLCDVYKTIALICDGACEARRKKNF